LTYLPETTSPLIDYRDRGILVEVDGDQPPESITADIQARLPAR
jgi:adenylate kinase family enzyme